MSRWLLPVTAALIGVAIGIGSFTFVYAEGYSYLTNDLAACANCHVMEPQYSGWVKSSHRNVAGCNDCHIPHDPIGKYATKASNGFWHSFYFTTGTFPDPIRIRPHNREVTEGACRDCHAQITASIHAEEIPRFDDAGAFLHDEALAWHPVPCGRRTLDALRGERTVPRTPTDHRRAPAPSGRSRAARLPASATSGRATPSPRTSARSAATPTCSSTRSSRSASR